MQLKAQVALNRLALIREQVAQARLDAVAWVAHGDDFMVRRLEAEIVSVYDDILSLKRFVQGVDSDTGSDSDEQQRGDL